MFEYRALGFLVASGRGSYTRAFSHYQPVPAAIQQQLTAAFIPTEEED